MATPLDTIQRKALAAIVGGALSLAAGNVAFAASSAVFTTGNGQSGGSQTPATPGVEAVGLGATGEVVRAAQQAMLNNGFTLKGGATGIFDKRTLATLKAFQKVVGVKVTGKIDAATAAVLKISLTTPAPAAATPAPLSVAALPVFGSRGDAVRLLQQTLVAKGVPVAGGIDGVFGVGTKNAVVAFQKKNNITPTGSLDQTTGVALGLVAAPAPAAPAAPGKLAEAQLPARGQRGDNVRLVQKALVANGIKIKGGVDGIFGGATTTAIKVFQTARGLAATGRLDLRTGIELGVVAAPAVSLEVFPVEGPCGFSDSWHAPRPDGRKHLGVDIIAREGQTLRAAISGTISYIYLEGTNTLTGNGLRILSADGSGTYLFYGHMKDFAPNIKVGTTVKAGDVVGRVGMTGTHTPHLHLEIHPNGGEAVNPYPAAKAKDTCRAGSGR